MINNSTIFLIFLYLSVNCFSQNFSNKFVHISLEAGLSQANVRCILQDKHGFLWLGTQDGLNRYDGYEFTVFKHNPSDSNSILGNLVTCLLEDRDGFLWIGTLGGLNKYDPINNRFTCFVPKPNNKNSLQGESVLSLYEDTDGTIWVGTYLGGVSKFDKRNNNFITYLHNKNVNSLSHNSVISICGDESGNLWMGTFGGGLNRYHKATEKFYNYKHNPNDNNSISSDIITSICFGSPDKLFIGTADGFNILNLKTNKIEIFRNNPQNNASLSGNDIQTVYKDKIGGIWIGTVEEGMNYFNEEEKKFVRFQKNENNLNSLSENNITSILLDRNGILWAGTNTSGLNKLLITTKKFDNFSSNPNSEFPLSNSSVRSIFEDRNENLWIGTDDGLNKFDPITKKLTKFFHNPLNKNSLSNSKVWAITEDRAGNFWIGTQQGLNKYHISQNKFVRFVNSYSDKNSIPFNLIRCVFNDGDSVLWLGTYGGGLIKFDQLRNKYKSYTNDPNDLTSIRDNIVLRIFEDSKSNIWLCTSLGLNLLNRTTGKFTRYFQTEQNQKLPAIKAIFAISEDKNNILWLGTLDAGLVKFDPVKNTVHYYSEKDGLQNDVIYGILIDRKENIWLSTNKGITKFNTKEEKFKNYDLKDGLASDEFNTGAFLINKKGKLFFGGINGLTSFYPDSLLENTFQPNIVVSKFRIFNKEINLKKFLLDGEQVALSYSDNYFSFEFTALDFTDPAKNQYAYKLEGADSGWIYSGTRRYAAYTNLEPGEYIFKVKASNSDGVWNNKGIAIKIFISPPYWKTWWFQSLSVLLFVSIVLVFIKTRFNQLKNEKEIQQQFSKQLIDSQEMERKRIAGELHDGIGQNLLIMNNRAKLGLKSKTDEDIKKQLENISDLALESIEDVRKIAYNLHPYNLDEFGLTNTIQSMLNKSSESSNIKFSVYTDNIDGLFPADVEINIFRIIQEGINNIIKHSDAEQGIVSINREKDKVVIIIRDDGRGIPAGSEKKQMGFGLKGITERINFIHGRLHILSAPNDGTTLKIELPIIEGIIAKKS